MFTATPLLALPVLAYNLFALTLAGGFGAVIASDRLSTPLFTLTLHGGAPWPITLSDLFLAVSLVILFIELLKSTTSRKTAIINHALSMLLFIVCLVELLLFSAFTTSTFFLISLMVVLDVLAGFIVTIVASRRDVDLLNDR